VSGGGALDDLTHDQILEHLLQVEKELDPNWNGQSDDFLLTQSKA